MRGFTGLVRGCSGIFESSVRIFSPTLGAGDSIVSASVLSVCIRSFDGLAVADEGDEVVEEVVREEVVVLVVVEEEEVEEEACS
jgi:hypothetical protein